MRKIDRKLLSTSLNADPEGVMECLENGANVNVQDDENGMTPMHHAVGIASPETVDALLSSEDIDLSIKDNKKRDPVELSESLGYKHLARKLSEYKEPGNTRGHGIQTRFFVPPDP